QDLTAGGHARTTPRAGAFAWARDRPSLRSRTARVVGGVRTTPRSDRSARHIAALVLVATFCDWREWQPMRPATRYSSRAASSGSRGLQRKTRRAALDSSGWNGLQRKSASRCQGDRTDGLNREFRTRIGVFRFPNCAAPTVTPTLTG